MSDGVLIPLIFLGYIVFFLALWFLMGWWQNR
jgi:hypothetical protein